MNEPVPIQIHRASSADAALLAELGARTFSEAFADQNTSENMAAYLTSAFSPEIQAGELADPSVTFFIAEHAGQPVGFVKLQASQPPEAVTGSRPIELVRIYAEKAWIGHGVGAALMQASLDEASRLGYQTLWLGVWEHNRRGLAFYHKWGFEKVGTHIFQLGDDPQTDLILARMI